jgi:predicted nucleic acid-binding protein
VGLVLDTSVVVDLLRGDIADESILDAAREPVMISTMTVHEVFFGLKDGEAVFTDAVLSSFAIVPVGIAEAELSAYWRRETSPAGSRSSWLTRRSQRRRRSETSRSRPATSRTSRCRSFRSSTGG